MTEKPLDRGVVAQIAVPFPLSSEKNISSGTACAVAHDF